MRVDVAPPAPPLTDRRQRRPKGNGYAGAGIPVYRFIDRDARTLTVYSEPENGTYRNRASCPYGAVVELPDLVGITLETEKLKNYAH